MHLDASLSASNLRLTCPAPASLPRFSHHDGYYCETCTHEGVNASALLADGCSERDAMCIACCTFDALECDGSPVSREGQCCAGGCGLGLKYGAWLHADGDEGGAYCFRCAVELVIARAPLSTCVEAVNAVLAGGGAPKLDEVIVALGYRTRVGSALSWWCRDILSSRGDVLLETVNAGGAWAWLQAQGVNVPNAKPAASRAVALARAVASLEPSVGIALRMRQVHRCDLIADEVA